MDFFTFVKKAKRMYLDYASLTPVDPRVLSVMEKYSSASYANPSSWYKEGVAAKKAMDEARKVVADFLHAHADEIIFTSGGTEANNIALQGIVAACKNDKPHIVISTVEHSSIMETASILENRGCEVTRIAVDDNGIVLLDELKKAIKVNTVLVSIMTVNNEIGTIQPIREIAKIIRQARVKFGGEKIVYPLFHTDAAQAGLYDELNVEQLGVDFLTLDAGKLYGPRGVGALYVKRKVLNGEIHPIMFGGGQEGGLRSGTENLPAIAGFAEALKIVAGKNSGGKKNDRENWCENESARVAGLKQMFIAGLLVIRKDISINGVGGGHVDFENSKSNRKVVISRTMTKSNISPNILNVSIPNIDNEFFVMQLDAAGIACSTKSSCLRDEEESYVLRAIGADSKTSIRFSFGRWTKKRDIKRALKVIGRILAEKP